MAGKIHTRTKRYKADKKGRCRASRPKSFTNEESAKAWAAKNSIKNFELKNLKNPECNKKKIIIIVSK